LKNDETYDIKLIIKSTKHKTYYRRDVTYKHKTYCKKHGEGIKSRIKYHREPSHGKLEKLNAKI
jgi:hypothetical protein